jgi:hypothetical protein
LGVKIPGRITSTSPSGSYVLRIKNFDHTGGLGTALNVGEAVTISDFNAIANGLGAINIISYWRDFDSDGVVGLSDFNMIVWHLTHDCGTPSNP